jgi:uncharacterized protein (DUF58 family)
VTANGWWCIGIILGLGFAGTNTGNNLVYLLFSMLLSLLLVSIVLSEVALGRLRLRAVPPDDVYAGRPAIFGAVLANGKRRLASYAIGVEVPAPEGRRVLGLGRLPAGAEQLLTWEAALPRRGRHRLPALRIQTRFPFGFYLKSHVVEVFDEVLVFPAVRPVAPGRFPDVRGTGGSATRRRGRGHDLYNLRPYRAGDDPRLIHWRSSAKAQALTVRELEEDTALDVRVVLTGAASGPDALERGVSEAASLAVHFLRWGAAVEVAGPGLMVPSGRGRAHERAVLTALALYGPAAGEETRPAAPAGARREVRVDLGAA